MSCRGLRTTLIFPSDKRKHEHMGEVGPAAWLVRGGRHGEREKICLDQGLAIVGWQNIEDIVECRTKEELRRRVRAACPDAGKRSVSNWTGQLWRFTRIIQLGDHVVLPLKTSSKSSPKIAVGRVVGEYQYDMGAPEGLRHTRAIEWLRTDIRRSDIQQDLRDSMGSLLTVCGLTRFDAAGRVAGREGEGSGCPQYCGEGGVAQRQRPR
jgi:restriction system protein